MVKMEHDYEKLGFRCGIEIHQQLDTLKLFCNCPSIVHDKNPDLRFKRRLRPVVGETGEIDRAAAYEAKKAKEMHYVGCSTSCCLVEADEEPPHPMNQEALSIALQFAGMLNAKVVDEVQVMRKTVVDGSNVSGFQRTALVATDGFIETSKGKVRIPTICLEEEAAKKIKETESYIEYRLDRLGIPLIEIATETDIKDPQHAKEAAEKLGLILRSTGKVKRGIGTIRQDVNVSIKGGARIEIKGFQDLKSIPKVIDNEIERQISEIKKGKKVESCVRKAEADFSTSYLRPMPGAARMYPETDIPPIRTERIEIEDVELIEDKAKRFESLGLTAEIAKKAAKSEKADLIDSLSKKCKTLKIAFIVDSVMSAPKEIRRKTGKEFVLDDEKCIEAILLIDSGKLPKESFFDALLDITKGSFDISRYAMMSDSDIEKEIRKVIEKNKGAPFAAVMGEAMKVLRGKADGKKVSEIIKKYI